MENDSRFGLRFTTILGWILIFFDLILGLFHILYPQYKWGQGRSSYFNLSNDLTLASWLITIEYLVIGVIMINLTARGKGKKQSELDRWIWVLAGASMLLLSFCEMTEFHHLFKPLGYPHPDPYQQAVIIPLELGLLGLLMVFLYKRAREIGRYSELIFGWGLMAGFSVILSSIGWIYKLYKLNAFILILRLSYMLGISMLLIFMLKYWVNLFSGESGQVDDKDEDEVSGVRKASLLINLFLVSFITLFLEILLFRYLSIFNDYLRANTVLSIALLGNAVGGVIGYIVSKRAWRTSLINAVFLMPLLILVCFGICVKFTDYNVISGIVLMLPFICGSVVVSIALTKMNSHFAYFIALVGAGLGTLFINPALGLFREESAMFFIAGLSGVAGLSLVIFIKGRVFKVLNSIGLILFTVFLIWLAGANTANSWLNVVYEKYKGYFPNMKIIHSASSFVGRYDVIRKSKKHVTLSGLENGRVVDTIRPYPSEQHRIDPRVPHTLYNNPSIFIVGLAGDGITKTSTYFSDRVYGVEINPIVVEAQTGKLVKYNKDSYKGIDYEVIDGRSYLEKTNRKFDIITLLNTHLSKGDMEGREPSPEYLDTVESFNSYLEHLTYNGVIDIEEPISTNPWREVPVWKMVYTMRETINAYDTDPSKHFFIFQWRTKSNSYIQILMKNNPFTEEDCKKLDDWMYQIDNIDKLEKDAGEWLGPIGSQTTVLYHPLKNLPTIFSRIIKGEASSKFLEKYNINLITDNKPFMFDVDPSRAGFKNVFVEFLLILVGIIPILYLLLRKREIRVSGLMPHSIIILITGFCFMMLEMVFIQDYEIFIGSPTVTFSCVVGTMLIFAGFGSLWSNKINLFKLRISIVAIIILIILQYIFIADYLLRFTSSSIEIKSLITVISLAPLSFFIGVPFPYIITKAKELKGDDVAAGLYAVNSVSGAFAVLLAMNISLSFGFSGSYLTGIILYILIFLIINEIAGKEWKNRRLFSYLGLCFVLLLFISPWLLSRSFSALEDEAGAKVYAICYGKSGFPEDKVYKGEEKGEMIRFNWYFWLIESGERKVLVDTGFNDKKKLKDYDIDNYVDPLMRLAQIGIHPNEISDIILTHAHWDHIGEISMYPNARVWINVKEFNYMKELLTEDRPNRKGMRLIDYKALLKIRAEGRLNLIDETVDFDKNIKIFSAPGHTPGSQFVRVETFVGPVVLAGDNTYMYKNNLFLLPIGDAFDEAANIKSIKLMQENCASPNLIIPGHDPKVRRYFPEVSDNIFHITVEAKRD